VLNCIETFHSNLVDYPREMIKENRIKTENKSNRFCFGSSGYCRSSSTVPFYVGKKLIEFLIKAPRERCQLSVQLEGLTGAATLWNNTNKEKLGVPSDSCQWLDLQQYQNL